jgi:hypothetical protein
MNAWKFTRGKRWTIIAAPSWFDARRHAYAVLGGDDLTFEMEILPDGREIQVVHAESEAHFVLRWEGSDAGPYPNRRLVVEERDE